MPASPQDLFAALDRLGIRHTTVTHPALFTVAESRHFRSQSPGAHTKNLFLRDKKAAVYLVVAEADAVIDLKGLHRRLGASGRFSFGSEGLMMELLGVRPGSVTPFGVINDTQRRVTVVLDAAMMEHPVLNYHPLNNTMTTTLSRDGLIRFLESTGHPPRIEAVSGGITPTLDD